MFHTEACVSSAAAQRHRGESLGVSVVALVASVPLCEMIFVVNHGHLSPISKIDGKNVF